MAILKRTVFCDNSDGFHRFADFARVIDSELGACIEPFMVIGDRGGLHSGDLLDLDWSSEMTRIDEIEYSNANKWDRLLSFGSDPDFLHGGTVNRTGR